MGLLGMFQTKSPRAGTRGPFGQTDAWITSKAVIHACANDICTEVDIGRNSGASHVAAMFAEIDIEIFDLGAPGTGNRCFEATAECPASIGVRRAAETDLGRLDVANCKAAGKIGQEAIECVTDAAAYSAEPAVASFAR